MADARARHMTLKRARSLPIRSHDIAEHSFASIVAQIETIEMKVTGRAAVMPSKC